MATRTGRYDELIKSLGLADGLPAPRKALATDRQTPLDALMQRQRRALQKAQMRDMMKALSDMGAPPAKAPDPEAVFAEERRGITKALATLDALIATGRYDSLRASRAESIINRHESAVAQAEAAYQMGRR